MKDGWNMASRFKDGSRSDRYDSQTVVDWGQPPGILRV